MARHPLNFRGGHATRLEALTDAVFGFAITLLVVRLEAPRSFEELLALRSGLVPFAASFAILLMVWVYHYRFFKRYDLDDGYTIFLNSILLFVILLYVYPLRYMFTVASGGGIDLTWDKLRALYTVYGVGYAAVFAIFALMYHHAYRRRSALQLSDAEAVDARAGVASSVVMVAVGVGSIAFAHIARDGFWVVMAGPFYAVIGPLQWLVGRHYAKLKDAAEAATTLRSRAAEGVPR